MISNVNMTSNVNFNNLKNWLTKHEIEFDYAYEKREDDYGNTRKTNEFVFLKNYNIQISINYGIKYAFNKDKDWFTMFVGSGVAEIHSNKEVYKELKRLVVH